MNCPVCNGEGKEYYRVNGYDSKLCKGCGHIYVTKPPEEGQLSNYYDKSFYENYMSGMGYDGAFYKVLKTDFEKKISIVRQILPQGSEILEVGAGPGYFAEMLQTAGYSVTAVELNKSAQEYAAKHGRNQIKFVHENISDKDCSIYGKEFDAVISWAVIEHVKDVSSFVGLLKSYTRKNGFIFIDTGITGKIARYLDNGYTSWLFPPFHLHVFSYQSIRTLVKKYKLSIVKILPYFNYFRNTSFLLPKIFVYYSILFIKTIFKRKHMKNNPGEINGIILIVLKNIIDSKK